MNESTKEFKAKRENQGEALLRYVRNTRIIIFSLFAVIVFLMVYIATKSI